MANGNGKNKRRKRIFIIGGVIPAAILIIVNLVAPVVTPITKADIKSKSSGIVQKLLADYNDHVKAGQVLVELDKEQLAAQVQQAKAQLSASEANASMAAADYERAKV